MLRRDALNYIRGLLNCAKDVVTDGVIGQSEKDNEGKAQCVVGMTVRMAILMTEWGCDGLQEWISSETFTRVTHPVKFPSHTRLAGSESLPTHFQWKNFVFLNIINRPQHS